MKRYIWYYIGLFFVFLYVLPYIITGENSFFRIHDYLEQDFVYTYLNAKYLFKPTELCINELFDGTYRASIQGHSFIQILLYKIFSGEKFLIANLFLMSFLGYTGMFVLLKHITKQGSNLTNNFITLGVSLLFSMTPLLLHGATVMCVPLFIYIIIKTFDTTELKTLIELCLISFFLGLSTSLLYGDFIFLFIIGAIAFISLVKKNFSRMFNYIYLGFSLMLGYFVTYFYTFYSLKEISHRLEWVLETQKFSEVLIQYLLYGNGEVPSFHLIAFILFCIASFLAFKLHKFTREYRYSLIAISSILLIILFSTLYCSSEIIINIREHLGGTLKTIQLDRISYLLSPLWYIIFGLMLIYINKFNISSKAIHKKAFILIVTLLFLLQFIFVLNHSDKIYKRNITRKNVVTYSDFFQQELMSSIRDYIGIPQSEYRVVSLGINPGVALFNGFYCLDGYSTNYSLEYKHNFGKIIDNELAKNEDYNSYYKGWGSRVYIISNEIGSFRPPDKINNKIEIDDLQIDYKQLKTMRCNYIFSGFKLNNAEKYIRLEQVFTGKNTEIYLYSLI